ncbi:TRC8 ring finger protein [Dermatophagoides pteronyssinus]|uniref:TRC8 ring finger protein n=1 Tax=Dermatophagoides pteronyssinus TaxID=6956 RepID=UPI003F675FF5
MSMTFDITRMSSPIRRRLYRMMDIILRIPPLFVMDSIFINNMKLTEFSSEFFNIFINNNNNNNYNYNYNYNININQTNSTIFQYLLYNDKQQLTTTTSHTNDLNSLQFQAILNNASAFIMVLVFLLSFTLFLLPTEYLFQFYKWMLSIITALLSYILNDHYVTLVFTNNNNDNDGIINLVQQQLSFTNGLHYMFITNYICQMILAISFIYLTGIYKSIIPFVAAFFFILPYYAFFLTMFISNKYLIYFPTITLSISLIYILVTLIMNIQNIIQALYLKFVWIKSYMRDLGLFALIESEWNRLHVPQVFRIFWIIRITQQAIFLMMEKYPETTATATTFDTSIFILNGTAIFDNCKHLMVRGCETLIAVLGMTSVLSGITHQIGCMMQTFLILDDPDDRSIGSISAIMFFILALQNGLTSMEPEKRFLRLYRNFCLLFTAMLHFIHNMVSPLLFSLSASRNMSLQRHLRALTVCTFLIISPYLFLNYLWTHHTISTWLLAVSAFGIEVIVKVIITLLIYTLFMIDAFRTSMWEQLDDYVYYVRTIGNLIEFVFGIFLFLNGTWILIFESGGTIRALMMCIHAYFNIWCQAIAGLKTFFKRYQALRKINSLPEASPEQLQQFDDVCSICYQELTTARITKCNHYFHSVCLRKWLYLQDICPLCHKTLYI